MVKMWVHASTRPEGCENLWANLTCTPSANGPAHARLKGMQIRYSKTTFFLKDYKNVIYW